MIQTLSLRTVHSVRRRCQRRPRTSLISGARTIAFSSFNPPSTPSLSLGGTPPPRSISPLPGGGNWALPERAAAGHPIWGQRPWRASARGRPEDGQTRRLPALPGRRQGSGGDSGQFQTLGSLSAALRVGALHSARWPAAGAGGAGKKRAAGRGDRSSRVLIPVGASAARRQQLPSCR